MWNAVDELLLNAIRHDTFPGCAMAAGQGSRVLYTSVNGSLTKDGGQAVHHTTRYDIGALTRVLTTVPLALTALELGMISLDDPITRYLEGVPSDKRDLTPLMLLTHTSGMPAYFPLGQDAENARDALRALLKHPLACTPGSKVRDSAMGFILLGFMLERVFAMPLDDAMKRYVSVPLGMNRTGFLPSGEDVAPTETAGETDEPQAGCPSDGNALFLHGVAGHAGLFTNLEDIIRFASMLACDGRADEDIAFSYRAIHLATTERTRGMNDSRGYGFHITKRSDPFLGHLWPSDGYGLQDPASGSLIAVSPEDGFFVVFLTNAAITSPDRHEMERFQKLLLNAAYAAFQRDD
ncbi:MAG: serine hydrolase domain-containing protein [Clostridia bacterium]